VTRVLALARAAGDADGADPLSEHVLLRLRRGGGAPAVHLLATSDGSLIGYAHVEIDPAQGASAELAVHPMFRRRGLGRILVTAAVAVAGEQDPVGRLQVWAHGDHPSAGALALSLGFEREHVLLQMRRPLVAPVEPPALPAGVRLRPFRPGADEQAWLAVNARAFADLPDQGRRTIEELRTLMAEPWFDPAGFLLAERDGQLLGFHWTKIHAGMGAADADAAKTGTTGADDAATAGAAGHRPMGEVYVLGVDPGAQSQGLGSALALAGLRHLHDAGVDRVMLYVDEANRAAVALYRRLGFARWAAHVNFRRQDGAPEPAQR
jgi:mycothiol synthase